jgi:gluconolactonase
MSGDGSTLYEMFDDRFRTGRCMNGDERLEVLHTGCRWAEGPIYLPAWRQVIWSDIPNDRMLRWEEETGAVSVFRRCAGHTNGNTVDHQGRLVTCEQGNRRVTRTEHDGTITVLADRWRGKRLNSPNDAAVKSDGSIWFSDPDFGITSDYEGYRADSEIGANNVYRIDPGTGEIQLVADCFGAPNGLVFPMTSGNCSSPTPGQASSGSSTYTMMARCPRAGSSRKRVAARTPASTTFASTTPTGSGQPRWTTVCTVMTLTARCSGD